MNDPLGLFGAESPAASDPLGLFEEDKKAPSVGDKSIGMLEAGASMVAGLPSQIAGGLYGLGTLLSGQGLDKAAQNAEMVQEKNFGLGRYKPTTETGERYAEGLGKVLNKPVELAGDAGQYVGGDLGRANAEVAAQTVMNFLPLPIAVKGMRGSAGALSRRTAPVRQFDDGMFKGTPEAAAVDNAAVQGDLFPAERATAQAAVDGLQGPSRPLPEAPVMPVEGAGPVRLDTNKRQMGFDFGEGRPAVMEVGQEGTVFPGRLDDKAIMGRENATELMQGQLDEAALAERTRQMEGAEQLPLAPTEIQGDLFNNPTVGPYPDSGFNPAQRTLFDDAPAMRSVEQQRIDAQPSAIRRVEEAGITIRENGNVIEAVKDGAVVGRLEPNITPEQARQLGEPASVDIVKVDKPAQGAGVGSALYERFNELYDGNIMPSGKTSPSAWNVWKSRYPDKVESFVKAEATRISEGANLDQVLSNVTDPTVAQRIVEATPAYAKAPTLSTMTGPSGLYKKQGGWVKTPFTKGPVGQALGKDARFSKFMEEWRPFDLTPEQYVAKYRDAPDMGKDRFSHLAASGMYMAKSSQSPLVKYVTDLGHNAASNIKALTRDFVHESYAPAIRKLSKEEFIKTAQLLNEADLRKQAINMDTLKASGFSDKAIQVIRQHQDLMNNLYPKLKEGAELNGMSVPENRTAYAASLMQGDFRRVVRDASGDVVGVIGANTRSGLNSKMKKLQGQGYEFGNEIYQAGAGRDPMGFQQLLQQLADDNPKVQAFVDKIAEQMSAESYLGQDKRTMGKKGVFGTTGRDATKNAYENARDFFEAQIGYAENTIKWNEMSKFVTDSKKVLEGVNGQENAKGYINNYINGELGRSTNAFGRDLDKVIDTIGQETGLGTTVGREALSAVKKLTNAKLLGLNVKFLVTNMIQPLKVSPEMTQFLSARGMPTLDPTGLSSLAKGGITMIQRDMKQNVSGVMQGAFDYAKKNHVYGSDLFESSNNPRSTGVYKAEKLSNAGAQYVERVTREMMYLSLVDQLHAAGAKPKDGLYQVAHKLTDMAMVDYDQKPMAYSDLGAPGTAMANLMTYKHNELSRMAMFARELPRNASGRAMAANIASQVAVAGLMGLVGYSEADWAYRKITEKLGKPQSLTELLLNKSGELGEWLAYGPLSKASGVDFSGSLGMEVMPGSLIDAAMPGVSSLGQTIQAVGEAAANPTEFNLRRAGRETLPLGFQGAYDRQMFSRKNNDGDELALSPNTGMVTAKRNNKGPMVDWINDKTARNFAFTGTNESKQKKVDWELQNTNKFYDEKRKDAVKQMRQAMFTNEGKDRALMGNKDFSEAVKKFVKAEGNPESLNQTLENLAIDLNLTPRQQQVLKDAASTSITNIRRLERNR